MPARNAPSPFNIEDYLRRLGMQGGQGSAPAPTTDLGVPYDPWNEQSNLTVPPSSDYSTPSTPSLNDRQSERRDRGDRPGPGDMRDYPSPNSPATPPTAKTPQECPNGYEWEDGGPGFPNGRCKIKGRTWEESQGQVAPEWAGAGGGGTRNSAAAGDAGGGFGGGASRAPANYAFDLQALLRTLGPSYESLIAKIRAGTNPYDPSTVEALVGNRKVAAERQKLDQRGLLQAQRSAAGMGTQGMTQQDIRSQGAAADIASASDINSIRENAIKSNYAAQIGRIDQEINALNSHANFVMGLASTDTARQSAQLQYASQLNALQAQRQNLLLQLQSDLDRDKLRYLFGGD